MIVNINLNLVSNLTPTNAECASSPEPKPDSEPPPYFNLTDLELAAKAVELLPKSAVMTNQLILLKAEIVRRQKNFEEVMSPKDWCGAVGT